ncbi:MAG: hypothetical protein LBP74_05805 [Treponema sp.]|jgi:hypothetical protein|nr:hypothetical protein [Treponema sp.]
MYSCPPDINQAIPAECRQKAEALFPPEGYPSGGGPTVEAAADFAALLGINAEYKRILSTDTSGREMKHFLDHFQNNLDLLIQKTWVEKADESRKEKLLNRVPGFITRIERGDYRKALEDFSLILEELAYLFFGAQSHKADFTEYALRIDIQMGLFWWYGGQIGRLYSGKAGSCSGESLWAVLLLGICYLTNF